MTGMPSIEPDGPLVLRWAGAGDPLGCRFCDTGATPADNHIQIANLHPGYISELHICPNCAHQADPDTAQLAQHLEDTFQRLLAFHDHADDTRHAADVLREMADELDRLRAGDRVVHELRTDITDDGVHTVYTTRRRDEGPA